MGRSQRLAVLEAVTAVNTQIGYDFNGLEQPATLHVRGNGTISSGTVLIEESDDLAYTGTWSLLATVDCSTLTGNKTLAVHLLKAKYCAVRARISAAILGGGTVDLSLQP